MLDGGGVSTPAEALLDKLGSPVCAMDEYWNSPIAVGLQQSLGWVLDVVNTLGQVGSAMNFVDELFPIGGGIKFGTETGN